jgi:bla regulator protein blaR1
LRCVFWFNPLVHVAAHLHRLDQEFACDAMVMARHPSERRRYGEAMLKAQLAGVPLPVGCHWSNHHPLKERIAMLKQPLPSRARRVVASAFVVLSVAASMMAAWAAQPASTSPQDVDFHYRIAATLDVDGERQSFSLRDGPGRPVGIKASTKAGREWRLELVVTPAPDDQVKIEGDLRVDGERVSSPVLIAMLDREAAIQVGSADGGSTFALAMTVSRHPGAPETAAAIVPKQPAPAYPGEAKARQQSGHVVLRLRVGPDGRVREAIVEKSVPAGVFDAASLDAVKQWTFDPPAENGVPAEGWVRVPIRFDADGDAGDGADASANDAGIALQSGS